MLVDIYWWFRPFALYFCMAHYQVEIGDSYRCFECNHLYLEEDEGYSCVACHHDF